MSLDSPESAARIRDEVALTLEHWCATHRDWHLTIRPAALEPVMATWQATISGPSGLSFSFAVEFPDGYLQVGHGWDIVAYRAGGSRSQRLRSGLLTALWVDRGRHLGSVKAADDPSVRAAQIIEKFLRASHA